LNGGTRDAATPVAVTVGSGTATSGTDFAAVSDFTISIPADTLSHTATFSLAPTQDDIDEANETVSIAGTTTVSGLSVTGDEIEITDDDARAVTVSPASLSVSEGESKGYTLKLDSAPTDDVTIEITGYTGTDLELDKVSLTFTPSNWDAAQTVVVTAGRDADVHPDTATLVHTVMGGDYGENGVKAADVVVTVIDNDTALTRVTLDVSPEMVDEENDESMLTATATLSGAPMTFDLVVDVVVGASTDSALEGVDYETVDDLMLTIVAGQTSGSVEFMLRCIDDDLDEDDEVISLMARPRQTDLDVEHAGVRIRDDDTASAIVTLSVDTVTLGEDAGATRLKVTGTLDGVAASSDTQLNISVGAPGDTASAGEDYAPVADFTLTIPAGRTEGEAEITLTPTDDAMDEDNERLTLVGSVAGESMSVEDVWLEIIDNDTRGVQVQPRELVISEGEVANYSVVLTSQPTGTVTVTPSMDGGSALTLNPSELQFLPSNWSEPQAVNLSAGTGSRGSIVTVTHRLAGADYQSLQADSVVVMVSTQLTLSVDTESVGEDEGASEITVTGVLEGDPRTTDTAVIVSVGADGDEAREGLDYSTVGEVMLRIAAGTTEGSVSFNLMPVDDDQEESDERLTVAGTTSAIALSVEDTALTIIDDDVQLEYSQSVSEAWLVRFGRTAADQVLEAVDTRLRGTRAPGIEATAAGQRLSFDNAAEDTEAQAERDEEARTQALTAWLRGEDGEADRTALSGARTVSARDLFTGTSFSLTRGTPGEGTVSTWGRGAVSTFDGREGVLTLDGEVGNLMLGAEFSRERAMAGLMLSHARGSGGYRGASEGRIEASLTALYPYGRYAVSERLSVWGVAGYGEGRLTVEREELAALETSIDLAMASVGVRGTLLEAPAEGGVELAVTSDAMAVRTTSEAVRGEVGVTDNLAAAEAGVTRLRLGLEGSRAFRFSGGASLVPSVELGMRHDGGDAETGFGADIGASLAWSDPARGLSADMRARGLLTHDDGSFSERGFAGSLAWDPAPDSARGPSLALKQTVGAQATGGVEALLGPQTAQALEAANDNDANELERRALEMKLDYGFGLFDNRWTGVPELRLGLTGTSRETVLGWRLAEETRTGLVFSLDVEGARQESMHAGGATGHRFGLGFGWRLEGTGTGAFEARFEVSRLEPANDPGSGSGAGAVHRVGITLTTRW